MWERVVLYKKRTGFSVRLHKNQKKILKVSAPTVGTGGSKKILKVSVLYMGFGGFRVYIKKVYARRGGRISWYLERGVGLVLDVQELGLLELNLGFKPYEIKGRQVLLDRCCGGRRIRLVLEANKARSRLLSVLLLELGFSPHLIELLDDVTGSLEGRHDHLDQNAVEVWVAGRVVFSRERGCGGWRLRRVLEVLKARSLVLVHRGTQHRKSVVDVEMGRRYSLLRADRYAGHVNGIMYKL